MNNTYQEIHQELINLTDDFILITGTVGVYWDEMNEHFVMKEHEAYVRAGLGDPDVIMNDISEGGLDEDKEWIEGLYEISFLVIECKPETDDMGRITMPGYYEIVSDDYKFIATFKEIERNDKLNNILLYGLLDIKS